MMIFTKKIILSLFSTDKYKKDNHPAASNGVSVIAVDSRQRSKPLEYMPERFKWTCKMRWNVIIGRCKRIERDKQL